MDSLRLFAFEDTPPPAHRLPAPTRPSELRTLMIAPSPGLTFHETLGKDLRGRHVSGEGGGACLPCIQAWCMKILGEHLLM